MSIKPAFAFILFLFFHFVSVAQPTLSPVQTKRLADASKLWGHVKYFHPWLQYKPFSWDSAFAAAVPAILEAGDKSAYVAALTQWLGVLNDPATSLLPTSSAAVASVSHPFPWVSIKDSVLSVTIYNLKDLDNWQQVIDSFQSVPKLLSKARYLLFDLRPAQPYAWADLGALMEYSNIESSLALGRVFKPSVRTVVHDGFSPERGSTSGGYKTFFRVDQVQSFTGTQRNAVPIAFLLNEHMPVPAIAITLQDAGKAIIVSEGPLNTNIQGLAMQFMISDSISVSIRTGELVRQNGKASLTPDAVLEKNSDPQVNISKTLALLQRGIPAPVVSPEALPVASLPRQTQFPQDKLYPTVGYRVLAAAKMFTVINTFFVNKKLMDRNWDDVFTEYLPQFVAARDSMEYAQAVAGMYTHIQDGHGFISSRIQPFQRVIGRGISPSVFGRVVEGKFVITALIVDSVAQKEGVSVGDVVTSINGKDILQLINEQRAYQPASNFVTQTRYISDYALCGDDNTTASLKIVDKFNKVKEVAITRKIAFNKLYWSKRRNENEGPVFKLLSKDIGYVDMERLEGNMVDSMLETFKNTKGFIMDMRGYPKGTAWQLAPRLSKTDVTEGALFTRLQPGSPVLSADGNEISSTTTTVTFLQKLPTTSQWRYTGKTVMLMNETTQSQAEHSGLFYKAANGTTFIGSQTAGANGDVTNFFIPGLINLTFSGQNVSYPNGQTMQRKGLVPDIAVTPTIKGIREGKDEVLDRAVLFLKTGK